MSVYHHYYSSSCSSSSPPILLLLWLRLILLLLLVKMFSVGDTVMKMLHAHFAQSERKHVTDVDVLIWQYRDRELNWLSSHQSLICIEDRYSQQPSVLRVYWFTVIINSSVSSYKYSALLYVFATTLKGNNTSDVLQCIPVIVVCDRWCKV